MFFIVASVLAGSGVAMGPHALSVDPPAPIAPIWYTAPVNPAPPGTTKSGPAVPAPPANKPQAPEKPQAS